MDAEHQENQPQETSPLGEGLARIAIPLEEPRDEHGSNEPDQYRSEPISDGIPIPVEARSPNEYEDSGAKDRARIIMSLARINYNNSDYLDINVGGIKFDARERSEEGLRLEQERDNRVRGLFAEGNVNATAQELAKLGLAEVVFRYQSDENCQLDFDTFGQDLLVIDPTQIPRHLDLFPNINRSALVNALMKNGHEKMVLHYIEEFPGVDMNMLVEAIARDPALQHEITQKRLDFLLANGVDRDALSKALHGRNVEYLLTNLAAFPNIDILETIKTALKVDYRCARMPLVYIDELLSRTDKDGEIAALLIENGDAEFVLNHITKFPHADKHRLIDVLTARENRKIAAMQREINDLAKPPEERAGWHYDSKTGHSSAPAGRVGLRS